jgi:hypothetical protein
VITTIDVQHSGIWQLSSAVVANAGACLIIDPGYFPGSVAVRRER